MAAFPARRPVPAAAGRRPTDSSPRPPIQGVSDFFTTRTAKGVNTGVGQALNFAPPPAPTTRWAATRCRSRPDTNSNTVGGFEHDDPPA